MQMREQQFVSNKGQAFFHLFYFLSTILGSVRLLCAGLNTSIAGLEIYLVIKNQIKYTIYCNGKRLVYST